MLLFLSDCLHEYRKIDAMTLLKAHKGLLAVSDTEVEAMGVAYFRINTQRPFDDSDENVFYQNNGH